MWTSVANHIQDVHDGHDDLYPECEHGPLDEDEMDKERLQPCKKHMQHSAILTFFWARKMLHLLLSANCL